MFDRSLPARSAGACAAVLAAVVLAGGNAHADTVVPLPGGQLVETLADGTVVTVRLVGESATISPSMGATPVHRNAWVSGSAQVEVAPASGTPVVRLFPGYTVGCQVNIAGGGADGGVTGSVTGDGNGGLSGSVGTSGGARLSLGPGQAKSFYLLDLEMPDAYGAESHRPDNTFTGTSGSVTWSDSTIGLSGCAGYAQARSFVKVEVVTETVTGFVTLWGQPFSLG